MDTKPSLWSSVRRLLRWRLLALITALVLIAVGFSYLWSRPESSPQDDLSLLAGRQQQALQVNEIELRLELLRSLAQERRFEAARRLYIVIDHRAEALGENFRTPDASTAELMSLLETLGLQLSRGDDTSETTATLLGHLDARQRRP